MRVADLTCRRVGIALEPEPDLEIAHSAEAQSLRVSEIVLAELEVHVEDATELAG